MRVVVLLMLIRLMMMLLAMVMLLGMVVLRLLLGTMAVGRVPSVGGKVVVAKGDRVVAGQVLLLLLLLMLMVVALKGGGMCQVVIRLLMVLMLVGKMSRVTHLSPRVMLLLVLLLLKDGLLSHERRLCRRSSPVLGSWHWLQLKLLNGVHRFLLLYL